MRHRDGRRADEGGKGRAAPAGLLSACAATPSPLSLSLLTYIAIPSRLRLHQRQHGGAYWRHLAC